MLAVVVLGLVVVAAWRWRAASRPGTAATAPMAAYLVGGAYVLPWYSAWALPTAALARRSFLGVLVATHAASSWRCTSWSCPRTRASPGWGRFARTIVIVTCAWGFLAAFVIRLVRSPATEDQPWTPGFPLRP